MFALLDHGLDEMAAGARAGFWPRMAALLGVGLVALAFLPWPVCVGWIGVAGGIDAVSWFVSREQYLGLPVRPISRIGHVITLVTGVLAWVVLGILFWRVGTAAGAVSAVVIWMAVIGFAQVYAYQSRAGYLLTGVPPSLAMLTTPLVSHNPAISDGLPVWMLLMLSVVFAVSSARQTMAARLKYEKAIQDLRDSEHSYRLLADNVTDVISLSAADNKRIYVSPSIERVLGFKSGELMTQPNFTNLHPDDSSLVQKFIAALTADSGPQTLDYRVFKKDGSYLWAETTFQRLNDGSDRVLAVSRDITARKVLESELKEAVARAEAAAAAKTDFLANMTHELRTPLTAIVGFAGVLRQSTSLSGQDARHVGLIHDASQTLLGVVGDVLDFSKLEAGGLELDPAPFDPGEMARSALAIVDGQAVAKGLEVGVHIDSANPAVLGDSARLRQVLLNLLSNAIKFTGKGRIDLTLVSRSEGGRVFLRAEVRDTGIGLDETTISGLFGRFTQADASVSRRFGGTGLGLAISKQIIDAMYGQIGASSRVGEGSLFWFEVELPLVEAWTAHAEPEHSAAPLDRPIRLLLVEDNAVNRELISTLLSPFDIEIDTACDGAEALEAVGCRSYDAILMDLQMPVMDGLTATRRIRALRDTAAARTPIIAMTANVLPEHVARCHEAGMDDHIGKPINLALLLATLERWTSAEAGDDAHADHIAS